MNMCLKWRFCYMHRTWCWCSWLQGELVLALLSQIITAFRKRERCALSVLSMVLSLCCFITVDPPLTNLNLLREIPTPEDWSVVVLELWINDVYTDSDPCCERRVSHDIGRIVGPQPRECAGHWNNVKIYWGIWIFRSQLWECSIKSAAVCRKEVACQNEWQHSLLIWSLLFLIILAFYTF